MIAPLLLCLLLSAEPATAAPLSITGALGPRPMVVPGGIAALAFSPDAKSVLAAGSYGDLVRFTLGSGEVEWRSDHDLSGSQRLSLLVGKGLPAVVGEDGAPLLYDPKAQAVRKLEHQEACSELGCAGRGVAALLADGHHVISGLSGALAEYDLDDKEPSRRWP